MVKKHLIEITDSENKKLQKIKIKERLSNVGKVFKQFINNYDLGDKE